MKYPYKVCFKTAHGQGFKRAKTPEEAREILGNEPDPISINGKVQPIIFRQIQDTKGNPADI